ncbi:VWA domain-containing protein [Bordetella genomosp. 13]|uniref:VWA domain-containing protein n=1 Tax=Bordetella genomosp. 13 TaxID=463040 RepID=UPI0011A8816E|nr:VWA domain-containing protein [Bordetella genomosp. 13]
MALALNLEKSAKSLVLSLEKAGIVTPPVLEVGFGLDVSGSFEDEHMDGTTSELLTRLIPWGLAFDPDRKLDVFTFSNGERNAHHVGDVNAQNYQDYVRRNIAGKVPGWNGGTDYSYLIERTLEHFGWAQAKQPGFFGRLMGRKAETAAGQRKRSVIFIATDGENSDKARTIDVLRASEARQDKVYFIFLGVSNQGSRFPFLESLGDQFSNTAFVAIPDLRKFVAMSDEDLNAQLIGDELLAWFGAKGN